MLAQHIPHDSYLSIIDSFPVPVCRFARATYSRSFREVATYGYDEVARHTYNGLRAHVRLAWPGVLVDCAQLLETGTLSTLEEPWSIPSSSLQIR